MCHLQDITPGEEKSEEEARSAAAPKEEGRGVSVAPSSLESRLV